MFETSIFEWINSGEISLVVISPDDWTCHYHTNPEKLKCLREHAGKFETNSGVATGDAGHAEHD